MPKQKERERRWIIDPTDRGYLDGAPIHILQGYFDRPHDDTLRVRIVDGKKAKLANKTGVGEERDEDETDAALETAEWLYRRCNWFVEKRRYYFGRWEIDVFEGPLEGLVIAEYERRADEPRDIEIPDWFGTATEVTETVDNYRLARMAYDLAQLASGKPIQEILLAERLPTIVLTGGPCSGKSTALGAIRAEMGDEIHTVPEVATILIAQLGFIPNPAKAEDYIAFQRALARIQLDFEALAMRQAVAAGKRGIVLDRGLRDGGAYMEGGWPAIRKLIPLPAEQNALYDAVAILEMPPRDVYERHRSNNTARQETYDEASHLGDAIREAWNGHRNVHLAEGSMDAKLRRVLELIREIV
jgi:CYTH domain-containing protein/predicted ATPase